MTSPLLAAITTCIIIYVVMRVRGQKGDGGRARTMGVGRGANISGAKPKPKAKPFNVKDLTPAELRIRYKQFLARAALFEMDGKESGVSQAEAKEATEKAVLCKAQMDILSESGPDSADINYYRTLVQQEIKAAAEGRS